MEPKINHATVEVTYYDHLPGAQIHSWIHRGDKIKQYRDITDSSVGRMTRLILKIKDKYHVKKTPPDSAEQAPE